MTARIPVLSASIIPAIALAICLLLGTSTPDASARGCGTINLGGPKIFAKHNMRCKTAKHYARRLYKTNGQDEPRNFNCTSGSNFNDGGFCEHESKNKYFAWHPAD